MKITTASLAAMPEARRRKVLRSLTPEELGSLKYVWPFWARKSQIAPEGNWRVWLILAGRGFGKTRCTVEWVRREVTEGRATRIALVGATASDIRDIIVEGESGILNTAQPAFMPKWEPSKLRLTWPNGAQAFCYSAEEPDRLRGKQHDAAACDELASWKYPETWDQLMFGLRLGADPRCVVATTPRPTPIVKGLVNRGTIDATDVHVTRGSTYDNQANLAPAFIEQIVRRYEGTRLGRQEINGSLLDDNPGALWKRDQIDRLRVSALPEMRRIVVAVDPAVSSNASSDETGIVVAGLGMDGHGYILEDASLSASPAQWGARVVRAYRKHQADRIVAEVNQGGDMVAAVIRAADPSASYKAVRATRGKAVRAEPVAALYEQGRVHHVGTYSDLEDQMCEWDPSTTGQGRRLDSDDSSRSRGSPDRVDALVWALSELMLENQSETAKLDDFVSFRKIAPRMRF